MLAAGAYLIYLGRGTSFSPDELPWVNESPGLTFREALVPHNGHLVFTSKILYKLILATIGSDYVVWRILVTAFVLFASGLIFRYAKTRIGTWAALAPSLVLLVFGSDILHVLVGNGITVLLALCCGLGAFMAIQRGDRSGDIGACLLLCLGVFTYTVALAFVVGVAVAILARPAEWRRVWVAAVPMALYGAWWLWSLSYSSASDNQLVASNVLLIPSWAFQSLAAALGSLTGLDYAFVSAPAAGTSAAGAALAIAALAGLAWRLRGSASRWLLGAIATGLTLAAIEVVARNAFNSPATPRYLYPAAFVTVIIGVEAVRGRSLSRPALIALFAAAAVGVATNLALLRDNSAVQRQLSTVLREELTGLELAGRAAPGFNPSSVLGGQNQLVVPFAEAAVLRPQPALSYVQAAQAYGNLGFSTSEISGRDEEARARTDAVLAAAEGLTLQPAQKDQIGRCRKPRRSSADGVSFELPPGGVALSSPIGGAVSARRLASTPTVPLGSLTPKVPAALRAPRDAAPGRWQITAAAPSLRLCALR